MTPGPWRICADDFVVESAKTREGIVRIMPTDHWQRDAALIAKVPEMVDLLRGLEWSADGDYCLPVCPSCGFVPSRHASDCRLHAILKLAEDASNGQ